MPVTCIEASRNKMCSINVYGLFSNKDDWIIELLTKKTKARNKHTYITRLILKNTKYLNMAHTLLSLFSISMVFNIKRSHSRNFTFGTLVSPGDNKCSFMEKQVALYFWESLWQFSPRGLLCWKSWRVIFMSTIILYSTCNKWLWADSFSSLTIINSKGIHYN